MKYSDLSFFVLLLVINTVLSSDLDTSTQNMVTTDLNYGCTQSKQWFIANTPKYDQTSAYQNIKGSSPFDTVSLFDQIANNQFIDITAGSITYTLLFTIPFILTVLIAPFACCCCLCPDTFTCCHPKSDPTRTIKVVGYMIILMALATIITIGILLLMAPGPSTIFQNTACAANFMMDDVVDGTSTEQYNFMGLSKIQNVLQTIYSIELGLTEQVKQFSSEGNLTKTIYQNLEEFSDQVKEIPYDGSSPYTLQYPAPINEPNPTSTIPSVFPQILGTVSNSSSVIGALSQIIAETKSQWNQLVGGADSSLENLNSITDSTHSILTQFNYKIQSQQQVDRYLNDLSQDIKYYVGDSKMAFIGIFLTFLAILSFIVVGVLGVMFGNRSEFRYLVYCGCVSNVLLSSIILVFGVAFSAGAIGAYMNCEYFGLSYQSEQFFRDHTAKLLNVNPNISVCIGNGDGNLTTTGLIKMFNVTQLVEKKEEINQIFDSFDVYDYINLIEANYDDGIMKIDQFRTAKIIDITSQRDIAILVNISNPQTYTSCPNQSFKEDSWIPSINQDPLFQQIPCQIQGNKSDSMTCKTKLNIEDRASGCTGCMDTFDIFKTYESSEVYQILEKRYSNCVQFADEMSNIWKNYYSLKNERIGLIKHKFEDLNSSVSLAIEDIQTVNQTFAEAITLLDLGYDIILNPVSGVLSNINCRPLGDTLKLGLDITCSTYLPFMHQYRLIFAILAWMILVIMILSTSFGVNTYLRYQYARDIIFLQDQQPASGYYRIVN